jgi:hypothetical protein
MTDSGCQQRVIVLLFLLCRHSAEVESAPDVLYTRTDRLSDRSCTRSCDRALAEFGQYYDEAQPAPKVTISEATHRRIDLWPLTIV